MPPKAATKAAKKASAAASAATSGTRQNQGVKSKAATVLHPAPASATSPRKAPKNWQALYNRVIDMRRAVVAPVDVIGCDKLADPAIRNTEAYRFQTLVALMLSAQTRDFCTAEAVCGLQTLPGGLRVESIDAATESDVHEQIRMVGMHNNKAKYLKLASRKILADHRGVVPHDLEGLLALPGVGPKMAHLFLQCADGKNDSGIGVDVHVHRIAQRWNWVPSTVKTPEDTRKALEQWLPTKHWSEVNEILVGFGQSICTPLRPKCHLCAASSMCPNAFKESPKAPPPTPPGTSKKLAAAAATHISRELLPGAPPPGATPAELLDRCEGSAERMLERGWLSAAVAPPAIPQGLAQRLSEIDAAVCAEQEAARAPKRKAARGEAPSVTIIPTDAGGRPYFGPAPAPTHGREWQLADIEDLVVPTPATPKTPARKKAAGVKSKYF